MDTLRDKVAVDINNAAVRALAGDLSDRGAAALPRRADVSDPDAFDGVRDAALRRFGRVDTVINSVGVLTNVLPEDIPVTAPFAGLFTADLFAVQEHWCRPAVRGTGADQRRRVEGWDSYLDYQISREPNRKAGNDG